MLKRVCSWCNRPLASRRGDELQGDGVTHGICPQCYAREERTLERLAQAALDLQRATGGLRRAG